MGVYLESVHESLAQEAREIRTVLSKDLGLSRKQFKVRMPKADETPGLIIVVNDPDVNMVKIERALSKRLDEQRVILVLRYSNEAILARFTKYLPLLQKATEVLDGDEGSDMSDQANFDFPAVSLPEGWVVTKAKYVDPGNPNVYIVFHRQAGVGFKIQGSNVEDLAMMLAGTWTAGDIQE